MSQKQYVHILAYAPNLIDFSPQITISPISIFLNETYFIRKASLNSIFSVIHSSISIEMWKLRSQYRQKLTKFPISQFAILEKLSSLISLRLLNFPIFSHEIFRSGVKLNFAFNLLFIFD